MQFRRFFAVLKARNLEFWRDKSSLAWNFIFPVLLVAGFAVMFGNDNKAEFKIGVLQKASTINHQSQPFMQTRYLEFVPYAVSQEALKKLQHHQLDLLVDFQQNRYWLNDNSAKGYLAEKLLLQSLPSAQKETVTGRNIRYVDWALPGILGMNMMFSCLFGVGYVLVRYRKNSVLKRLQATPLTAFEFVSAQVLSRLGIVLVIASAIYAGCDLLFDFVMLGSYIDLLLVTILGAMAMISLGLLIACRSRSEELTGGMLNMASWPMMILSGVWFSLEGAPQVLQWLADILPLTHLVAAARAIMTDGATLSELHYPIGILSLMTVSFLLLSAWLFRWQGDGR
ncbi:ABC transporter permease [Rheinheimera sp.]|uniref:ABC transporter permease n=1 Tax=Rheinheimera sp. TaxID=1869214 RepID=UPI0027B94402|nr:ABC transporter permease [Rheinheimera sp.]